MQRVMVILPFLCVCVFDYWSAANLRSLPSTSERQELKPSRALWRSDDLWCLSAWGERLLWLAACSPGRLEPAITPGKLNPVTPWPLVSTGTKNTFIKRMRLDTGPISLQRLPAAERLTSWTRDVNRNLINLSLLSHPAPPVTSFLLSS